MYEPKLGGGGNSIVTNGLILNLDAGNASSYPGSGTNWTDLTGNGNNGTLINGVGYSSLNNGSLVFDGVNDWVENLSSTLLNNLSKFTLNTWFKVNNTSLNNSIFSFGRYGGTMYDILLGVYGNYLFCQVNNGADGSAYINGFTSTSWNNVQVVYDGTLSGNSNRLKMYLNGVLLTLTHDYTVPSTTANNASGFSLGSYISGNFNNRLFGNIANCLIYNTSLSNTEVTQNFDATKTRFGL